MRKKEDSHIGTIQGGLASALTFCSRCARAAFDCVRLRVPEVFRKPPRDPPGQIYAQGPQKRSPRGHPQV
eukprot:13445791-Heterocapsa_arctica.AAC.1